MNTICWNPIVAFTALTAIALPLRASVSLEQREIRYRSSADGTIQPAMFFAPHVGRRVPLLVALHTWSGDYRQDLHSACADWCQEKDWAYIHPTHLWRQTAAISPQRGARGGDVVRWRTRANP